MKLWTLTENTACRADLICEHGLSLYIETGDHKILFDAGQTDAFAHNAGKLGIDVSQVDFAVLSHGHFDHGGGLLRFLELNDKAPIYVSPHAFMPHYNAADKYIGLDSRLAGNDRLIFIREDCTIAPGITLYPCRDAFVKTPVDTSGLTVVENGQKQPEDFRHEQYLQIQENGNSVLFSGCSHRGILNIARRFVPDVLIGGFHFSKLDIQDPALAQAAHAMAALPTRFYTGHCTGTEQFAVMKEILGDRLTYLATGSYLEL